MPSFDISSVVDEQEVRNAVDQASREIGNRFDFKDTNSSIELGTNEIVLRSVSTDRLTAVRQVLEEKFAKRKLSMKSLDYGTVEDAAGGSARQLVKLAAGINADKAKEAGKTMDRNTWRLVKRDDLQAVIQACKEEDFGIPLQFGNFRD